MDAWKDTAIVRHLQAELLKLDTPEFESLLAERGEHCVPLRIMQDVAV
jgi:hypothetical protein